MPDPRLSRGAFARLAVLTALGAFLLAPGLARAEDTIQWPCGPLAKATEMAKTLGGSDFITLTGDQWQFLRGVFVQAPDTPMALPPGDRAAMSLLPDGSGSVIFVDGDRACAPIELGRAAIEVLMMVGRGDIVHAGQRL